MKSLAFHQKEVGALRSQRLSLGNATALSRVVDQRLSAAQPLDGADLAAGERPVVTIPVGYWQAAEMPEGTPFAFGTNVCALAFSYQEFAIARREDLLRDFPDHADLIIRLTRGD